MGPWETDPVSGLVEGLGHAPVGLPDLLGEPVELLEVTLAEADLLAPALHVDVEQAVEVLQGSLEPVEVELVLGRDDADRGLAPGDLAVLELEQPEQRTQVVAVAGPQEA